jgi:hypothetical protein
LIDSPATSVQQLDLTQIFNVPLETYIAEAKNVPK